VYSVIPWSVVVRHRNRSCVVESVGREPLMFARVENGVTKFSPKKQKTPKKMDRKQQFSVAVGNFYVLAAEKLILGGGDNFKTG